VKGRLDPGVAPLALLCGGRATRLGALAAQTPKALLDVNGRPFIDHQLDWLRRRGLRRVVLCLGHLGQAIEEHVRRAPPEGLEVAFAHDGADAPGTAGALRRAAPLLGPLFWVLYGDSLLDVDLGAVMAALPDGALGVLTVLHNRGAGERSNVRLQDGRLLAYDKQAPTPEMEHVDYGLSLLRAGALEGGGLAADLGQVYTRLAADGRLAACAVGRPFHEIGSPAGLFALRAHLRDVPSPSAHTTGYIEDAQRALALVDAGAVERLALLLASLRGTRGRLFVLGVGGSAANASHAVNDFRVLCGLEAYAPTDNVAELTARVNDDGWEGAYAAWLQASRLGPDDVVLVFSVGGGDRARGVSANLVRALDYAREVGARVGGVVGRTGGATAQAAEACVVIPTVNTETVTAHTEALQAVVWHLLVTHPALQARSMKWESLDQG
jgi:D-sedoheptulose 7-phosphate isomerase